MGLFLFSIVYTPIANREEVFAVLQEAYYKAKERRTEEARTTVVPASGGKSLPRWSLKKLLSLEILGELLGEAVMGIAKNIFLRR